MTGPHSRGASSPEEVFVQTGILQTRAARIVDGCLVDLIFYPSPDFSEEGKPPPLLGGIFAGRVVRAVPGVDAVFVDILPHVTGFLATRHTDRPVHEGACVLVQVIGEARGDKGPQLTARGLAIEWTVLQKDFHKAKPKTRLDHPLDPEAQIVRDFVHSATAHVWFNTHDGLTRAQEYARTHVPDVLSLLHVGQGDTGFSVQDLDAEIDAALNPRVPLPCGGWITFESTEGFTAIDVNSGGFALSNAGETALEVNRQAAQEIARQVRLRSIGGLIVIDFIQMKTKGHGVKLQAVLKATLKADPMSCQVAPLSPFGVIEMTRRRGRPSLRSILTEPAAAPRRILTLREVADRLARALEREAAAAPGLPVELKVSAELGAWLSAHGVLVQMLESRVAAGVEIYPQETWERTRFEVHVQR